MKLWIKIVKGEKLLANAIEQNDLPLTRDCFEETLPLVCHKLDLSTPISLSSHFLSLVKFNIVEYIPRDFIEPVDFSKLVVENIDRD